MSSDQGTTNRRRLLKSIGVTGLALGAAGVTAASGSGGDATQANAESDETTPDGTWEYKCDQDLPCCSGSGCQQYRRYCVDGDCSGWERSGCCSGDCSPISC